MLAAAHLTQKEVEAAQALGKSHCVSEVVMFMKKWRPSGSLSCTQLVGSLGLAPPEANSELVLL